MAVQYCSKLMKSILDAGHTFLDSAPIQLETITVIHNVPEFPKS